MAHQAVYRANNRDKVKATITAWRKANPEAIRIQQQRRRARKRSLPATLTRAEWEAIKAAYKGRCAYCGKKPKRLTQDHVIPISKGGGTTKENIVPACHPCNVQKFTNLPANPVQLVLV